MSDTEPIIGPRPLPLLTLFLRTFGGLGGGLIGTAVVILIAFLGSGILSSALGTGSADGTIHPLFVFVFMVMMFLGSTAANLLGPLFIGLADREKYQHVSSTLTQIFIANVIILMVVAPVYMVVAGFNVELLAGVAALQVVVSAFASALILEIIAAYRYALLGVYSTAFAVLVSSGIYFLFFSFVGDQPLILLFLALPVMWVAISLFSGLLEWIYGMIYKLYGTDFLSSTMKYGRDVRWTTPEEDEVAEASRDVELKGRRESGSEFLGRR